MADDREKAVPAAKRQTGSPMVPLAVAYAAGAGLSLALLIAGAMVEPVRYEFIAAGCLGLIVVGAIAPLAFTLAGRGGAGGDSQLGAQLAALSQAVERLHEEAGLSDDARRVLNRRRERELLRRAIEEDVAVEDWDAAMILVKELADRFGYRADAEEFRQRIESARYQTVERRVSDSIDHLDHLITQRRWDAAQNEAARVARLYPDSARVEGLRHRVEHARTLYKADLERRFLHASQDERIDEAMELLKELDLYLTEAEAGPYRELARGIIGKARENLGVEFKLAVHDRRWEYAAKVGERIIAEFPNTRMAQEVRVIIDSVRNRASAMA